MNACPHPSCSAVSWFAGIEVRGELLAWQWLVWVGAVMFAAMQVCGGVVRWILDMAGASVLTYVPNVLMLVAVGWVFWMDLRAGRTSMAVIFGVLGLLLSMVLGWFNTGSLAQVVFGLWVLTPLLFGMVAVPVLQNTGKRGLVFIWVFYLVATLGTVVHSLVDYPWVGLSYSVGNVELEGAREWYVDGGHRRLSGLARSSFDVAGQVLVLSCLLCLWHRNGWLRLFVWCLSATAISLSTSKGILLAALMTALSLEALIYRMQGVVQGIQRLGWAWMLIPPVLGWSLDWSQLARTDLENPLYGSFIDRMNDMWPRAWALAYEDGLPLLGRGLGGIGVPLSIFEPDKANAADNLFVYVMVLLGVLAIPVFMLAIWSLNRLALVLVEPQAQQVLALATTILWYGGVSNIVEHAFMALALGCVIRVLVCVIGGQEPWAWSGHRKV